MKKILLGLHGGATADGAVRIAHLLRSRTGASIDAVAVLQPLPVIDYGYGPVYTPDPDLEDDLANHLHADVEKQLNKCDLGGAKLSVLRGQRTSSILDAAAACSADLIVVGIGPHDFGKRALGGETALHLAQCASTPVLAVPAGMRTLPRRILVAVDFSPASLAAARLAASLLAPGDVLELAHVGTPVRIGGVVLGPALMTEAERRMEEFAAAVELPSDVDLVANVFGGEPTRVLLDVAGQTHADMIALGSHGYNLWQRALLGSVSSKVLRLAQCAVLIYPSRCVVAPDRSEPIETAVVAGSA